jgi:hypothetical protein
MPTHFRPTAQLAHLTAFGVDFVVVGGIAVTLHGSDRDTFDLDICASHDPENLEILGRALIDMESRLRGVDDDVPFVPDGRTLGGMRILTLDTKFGPLDILMRPDGSPPYSRLRARARRMDIGTSAVLVASTDDLLSMKRPSKRTKDKLDVETLEAIKTLERRLRRRRN